MPLCPKHQPQARAWSMIEVPAGPDNDDTYHIPISGLRFGTTWQELKDYVREVAEVIHVEVFPISTTGWVRVKGLANFEKAFEHLDGGTLKGCNLMASDKNRDMPIRIRDIVTGRAARPDRPSSPCGACPPPGYKRDGDSRASHTEPALSPRSTSSATHFIDPNHGMATGYTGFEQQVVPMPPGMQYTYSMTRSTTYQAASYNQQYASMGMNSHVHYDTTQEPYPSGFPLHPVGGGPNIITGQYDSRDAKYGADIMPNPPAMNANGVVHRQDNTNRGTYLPTWKVLVKNLPRRETTVAFVYELIHTYVSAAAAAKIGKVKVGLERSDKSRCYALLHVTEFEAATGAAAVLDGLAVANHLLEARIPQDGEVIQSGRPHHRGRNAVKKPADRKDRKANKDPGYGYVGEHRPSAPLSLAAGTNLVSSDKGKAKEKEGRKMDTPVVVNGSTSRSKQGSEKGQRC